jgi:hypothetical protein
LHLSSPSYRIPHPNLSGGNYMNFKRLAALIGLSILGSSAIAQVAIAGEYDTVHKWTNPVDQKVYVYFPGQTAEQPVTGLTAEKVPALKTYTLNNCGIAKVTKSASSPIQNIVGANGATVNFSAKSSGADPTCTSAAGVYTSSWASATVGDVLESPTAYYIKGGTEPGAISTTITADGNVTSKANKCGFLRVGVTTSRTMTNFSVGTTDYTLATTPSVTYPMICKKISDTDYRLYLPTP